MKRKLFLFRVRRLKILLIAFLICIALIFAILFPRLPRVQEYLLPDFIKLVGHSYEYKFRSLTLNDFKNIEIGDNYSEIVKEVGVPNGTFGMGIIRNYYVLNDGSCVVMWFNSNSDGWTELIEIGAADRNEREFGFPHWMQ